MRMLAAVLILMLLLPLQLAEPQEPKPGDRCYSDTRCSGDSTQTACLAEKRAALARCLAGGNGSSGSQSSSGSGSDQNRQQALDALSSAIGDLENSMEQSRRERAARREAEAEAEQRAWEEQQYTRSSTSGDCGDPSPLISAADYRESAGRVLSGLASTMDSAERACARGSKYCGELRASYEDSKRMGAELNCLAGKAEQRRARLDFEQAQRIASFNQYLDAPEHLRMMALSSEERQLAGLTGADELQKPGCLLADRYGFTNKCYVSVVVAWAAAEGPCKPDVEGFLPCAMQMQPEEFQENLAAIKMTGYFSCLSPGVIFDYPQPNMFACVKPDPVSYSASSLPNARSKEQSADSSSATRQALLSTLEPEFRSHIGNKSYLASESSLSRLRERSAISDYGFDKDLLANQCVESYYETHSSGTKSSRFKNNCNRKIVVSWFDSDGWCKERSDADWTCSTGIGPNQVVGTTKQPEGTRREYGACFDPGLPVRRGSEYGCAAWSKMGGSDYVPGDAMEWVERLTAGN